MTTHTTPTTPSPRTGSPRRWFALARWFAPARRPAARRTRKPSMEFLEDRCVPTVFNVNSLADVLNPGPGIVTLRSAIQQANQTPGGNTINLTLPGTYQITLPGAGTGTNASGAFAILPSGGDLTLQNTSGGKVTLDGGGLDRVFDINPGFDAANPTPKFLVTIEGVTITDGRAFDPTGANADGPAASGGGIRDQGNASLTLLNDVVTDNAATADGGGVSMENTVSVPWTLTVENSIISNNRAGDAGGGLETDGSGKVFVTDSTITGNSTINQGGGIWLDAIQAGTVFQGANLTVTGSLVSNNTSITNSPANNDGGGIGNAGNGTVTIQSSTIASNVTGGVGGGFGDANAQGTLVVLDSTFVNNVALGNGGGIEASGPSTTINDSTVTGNESLAQGGGLAVTSAAFTLNNTVVAQDQVNNNGGMNFQGTAPDVLAAVTTANGDFIGVGDVNLTGLTNDTNGNRVGTVAAPLDPLLGPLQNNGGATPTRAPLPGSPLVDSGVTGVVPFGTTQDQRGFLRLVGPSVDIGAVEFQPPATTTTLTASTLSPLPGQPVTFTATVTAQAANSNVPSGTVTFSIDGMPQAAVPLVNGVATLTLSTLPFGQHAVTATYSGDVNFTASTGAVSESVVGLQDVTRLVTVRMLRKAAHHGRHGHGGPMLLQVMNVSGSPIQGPVYLVLDGLMRGVRLRNATGHSQTHVTPGDPFVLVTEGGLGAGQAATVSLMFTGNQHRMMMMTPSFTSFVLAGPGVV
jgi:hypothetical protein